MMQGLNLYSRGYIESVSLPVWHNRLLFRRGTWEMTSAGATVSYVHIHHNTYAYTAWMGRHIDSFMCTCMHTCSMKSCFHNETHMQQCEQWICSNANKKIVLWITGENRLFSCTFTLIFFLNVNVYSCELALLNTTKHHKRQRHIHIHILTVYDNVKYTSNLR